MTFHQPETIFIRSNSYRTVEPQSKAPLNALLEILAAHALTLQADDDVFLVVRVPEEKRSRLLQPSDSTSAEPDEIETITVSASRYRISRDIVTSQFGIDQRLFFITEAGSTNHDLLAVLTTQSNVVEGRLWRGEVDQHIEIFNHLG